MQRVRLAYGSDGLEIDVPDDAVVLTPVTTPAVADADAAVRDAVRPALAALPRLSASAGLSLRPVAPGTTVAVIFPDLTRHFPHRTVLPPLLDELTRSGVRDDDVVLCCATGTHRQATDAEMRALLGDELVDRYRVYDHDCTDDAMHRTVGEVDGTPIRLATPYLDAALKITTGFVEPHFFAGYSGGPKGVCPGLASLDTVLEAHSPARIADARATWLELDGNPVHRFVSAAVQLAPPHLSVDVALGGATGRELSGVWCGPLPGEHRAACAFVREHAVLRLDGPADVVVTTNGGHPLDRNLYQAVKGMDAGARLLRPGGILVAAAACGDGLPDDGSFGDLLRAARTPADLLSPAGGPDQWQVQVLGRVLAHAGEVLLHTGGLADDAVRAAHLLPCVDIGAAVHAAAQRAGTRVAVLPQGPLTVASVGG